MKRKMKRMLGHPSDTGHLGKGPDSGQGPDSGRKGRAGTGHWTVLKKRFIQFSSLSLSSLRD